MDKILVQLIKNQNEADLRFDYSNTDFEAQLNINVVNAAEELTNAYIQYKKLEINYNKALQDRNNYYAVIERLEHIREERKLCQIGKANA